MLRPLRRVAVRGVLDVAVRGVLDVAVRGVLGHRVAHSLARRYKDAMKDPAVSTLPPETQEVFRLIGAWVNVLHPDDEFTEGELAQPSLATIVHNLVQEVAELRKRIEQHDAKIKAHGAAIARQDAAIARLDAAIARLDAAIARQDAAIARQGAAIASLEQLVLALIDPAQTLDLKSESELPYIDIEVSCKVYLPASALLPTISRHR